MADESRVVAVQQPRQEVAPLSAMQLLERRESIANVIANVMVEEVHYGIIPGTRGYSLLKAGAEVLLSTFHIAVEPNVTDLCTQTEVRFLVECRGIHMQTGMYVGSGMGVCSSNEEKYRWRKARSPQEWEHYANDPSMRRLRFERDSTTQQVRQSPYDVFQTIMSMAEKRAKVDLANNCLAASECLKRPPRQPDPKPDIRGSGYTGAKPGATPANGSKAGTTPTENTAADQLRPVASNAAPKQEAKPPVGPLLLDEDQRETIARRLDQAGLQDNHFFAQFEIGTLSELEASRYEAALAWIAKLSP